eukprot:3940680-Rhodomonas_salina.2
MQSVAAYACSVPHTARLCGDALCGGMQYEQYGAMRCAVLISRLVLRTCYATCSTELRHWIVPPTQRAVLGYA